MLLFFYILLHIELSGKLLFGNNHVTIELVVYKALNNHDSPQSIDSVHI